MPIVCGMVWMLIATALLVGLASDVEGEAGNYYAATYCTRTGANGVWGTIRADTMYAVDGSAVASFVNIGFPNGDWFQVGSVSGDTAWGDTGTTLKTYWEYRSYGQTSGALLDTISEGTTHTFYIYHIKGTNQWSACVDFVVKKTWNFPYTYGWPQAMAESHDTLNYMDGSVTNLQYGTDSTKGTKWTAWPGYTYDVDWPYELTQVSTIAWDFGTDWTLLSDNFDDGVITDWTIVNTAGGYCGVSTAHARTYPYSLQLQNPVPGDATATHTFLPQSEQLEASAWIMVANSCSSPAYFYVGGGKVTFGFWNGYLQYYEDSSGWNRIVAFQSYTWYCIDLDLDLLDGLQGTYDIHIYGGATASVLDAELRSPLVTSVDSLQFRAGYSGLSSGVTMWIDDVYVALD